jgi:hypothetical protein
MTTGPGDGGSGTGPGGGSGTGPRLVRRVSESVAYAIHVATVEVVARLQRGRR